MHYECQSSVRRNQTNSGTSQHFSFSPSPRATRPSVWRTIWCTGYHLQAIHHIPQDLNLQECCCGNFKVSHPFQFYGLSTHAKLKEQWLWDVTYQTVRTAVRKKMHCSSTDVLSFQHLKWNKIKEYNKYKLKTIPHEYIIYEREKQEVKNRLQDVHDYNETRNKWGWKTSRETHYRSWNYITKSTAKEMRVIPLRHFMVHAS